MTTTNSTTATRSGDEVEQQNRLLEQIIALHSRESEGSSPSQSANANANANKKARPSQPLVKVSKDVPAGRGLVFTQNVAPSQVLLRLSGSSLINVKTYRDHFHPDTFPLVKGVAGSSKSTQATLSSPQSLSLLLSRAKIEAQLNNPQSSTTKTSCKNETLRTFVRTLPSSFDTTPLFWSTYVTTFDSERGLARQLDEDEAVREWKRTFYAVLVTALPRHSQDPLKKVCQRFHRDWTKITTLQTEDPTKLANPIDLVSDPARALKVVGYLNLNTFLWAWLCVNSRCVFLPLGLADHSDNFTMAPMLDMANHTSDPALECKVRYTEDGGLELCAPDASSRPEKVRGYGLKQADECFITYGPHNNESLLSEYGFALPAHLTFVNDSEKMAWRGNRYADVLIDDEVKSFLDQDKVSGEQKMEMLQDRGYWGDFSLHPFPEPAHPSHRLVPALRLLALDLASEPATEETKKVVKAAKVNKKSSVKTKTQSTRLVDEEVNFGKDPINSIERWEATLTGYAELVSEENEQKAHSILIQLCDERSRLTDETRRRLHEAKSAFEVKPPASISDEVYAGCRTSLNMVEQLIQEEERILELVKAAAERNAEW